MSRTDRHRTDEFEEAVELLANGAIKVADLATDVIPLSAALEAFVSLRAARTMKILIDPHA